MYVGFTVVTPKTTLCFQGRYSAGGNTGGCRLCGTGNNFARTLHLVVDLRQAEDTQNGVQTCSATDTQASFAEEIYNWMAQPELCDRDFSDDDGGAAFLTALTNAMPGIMRDVLCVKQQTLIAPNPDPISPS